MGGRRRSLRQPRFGGAQTTAGSNSTRGMWKLLREAGAGARGMLISAAAKDWGVAEDSLTTDKGVVIHQASNRRATYGSLVDKAAALPVPKTVTLKDPKAFKLLGKDVPRLDIPKQGERHRRLRRGREAAGPARGRASCAARSSAARWRASTPTRRRPSRREARGADREAASRWWRWLLVRFERRQGAAGDLGRRAARHAVIGRHHEESTPSSRRNRECLRRKDGDFDAAYAKGAKTIERVFEAPYLAHACMEPMNCTANVTADRCDVYLLDAVADDDAAGGDGGVGPASRTKCSCIPQFMGGGFGRRGEGDFVADAVETSKKVGAPGEGDVEPRGRHPARLLPPGHLRAACGRRSTPAATRRRGSSASCSRR
jgi:isoquinoline 1-oxidoreductase beta subunit